MDRDALPQATSISPTEHRLAMTPHLVRVLSMEAENAYDPLPTVGCEVHEAAVLALGDAFAAGSVEVARIAIEGGVLTALVLSMARCIACALDPSSVPATAEAVRVGRGAAASATRHALTTCSPLARNR